MSTQVRVTSIDSLERFRASLIVFLAKARRSMDEVADDVRRTRIWLQSDQRVHWEHQIRKRRKVLEQAEAELFSAKLSGLRETSAAQQAAVTKGKRAVAEAEEKLRNVKSWNGRYDGIADPLVKSLEGLRFFLDHDLPRGVTLLAHAQKTLEAYAESPPPASLSPGSAISAVDSSMPSSTPSTDHPEAPGAPDAIPATPNPEPAP